MGGHYHELVERAPAIRRVITQEEVRFRRTLDRGRAELDAHTGRPAPGGTLSGEVAFYLKATHGLPIQVTKDIVEERGYTVDMVGFSAAEDEHSVRSGGGQAMGRIESSDAYRDLLNQLKDSGSLPDTGVLYDPYSSLERGTILLGLLSMGSL